MGTWEDIKDKLPEIKSNAVETRKSILLHYGKASMVVNFTESELEFFKILLRPSLLIPLEKGR